MEKVCKTFDSSRNNPFTAVVCMFVISLNGFTHKVCTSNKLSNYAGSLSKHQLHILPNPCKIILIHLVSPVHKLDHDIVIGELVRDKAAARRGQHSFVQTKIFVAKSS